MTRIDELPAAARAVIDGNRYMVLSTADRDGRPWASPVYFAHEGYRELYWVSSPEAMHSHNIEARADVSVVVFDSQVPVGSAQAVYMRARAAQVADDDLERCAEVFRSARDGGARSIEPRELRGAGPMRLYRAVVEEHSILVRGSDPDLGRGVDSRLPVSLTD